MKLMNERHGLVRIGHHLGYGYDHGFGMWLPYPVLRFIVHVWNPFACFVFGHDVYGPWDIEGHHHKKFCSACCKEWDD